MEPVGYIVISEIRIYGLIEPDITPEFNVTCVLKVSHLFLIVLGI